jgi:hypothetical protein
MKNPDIYLLSQKAEEIVSTIDKESILVYLFIRNKFKDHRGGVDPLFHFVYRSFYRLDNAGLTPEFKAEYFRCLERRRDCKELNLPELTRELYKLPNLKGQNSLQFSFITKLANTIDDNYPIYDSEIARVFKFKPPYHHLSFEDRLSKFIDFYAELKSYYASLISEGSCKDIFSCFYKQFPNDAPQIPEVKLIDFFFWSAGKLQANETSNKAVRLTPTPLV